MARFTAYQVPTASNGAQIVKDQSTGQYYITTQLYADLIGDRLGVDVENNAARREEKGKVIYLGEKGMEGIKGKYLLAVEYIFQWMLIDNPQKAIPYAMECVKESLTTAFKELAEKDRIDSDR
jgi:hypothetical protein